MKVLVVQSCPTLCNTMDCGPLGSSVYGIFQARISSIQFSSVTQLCQTLCNPMDYSWPGFPVHYQLLELAHVHRVSDGIQPFRWEIFASGGQSIGVSASASVLPMNIQDWFPLGLTGWSLCSPRDSEKFSPIPRFKSINYLALRFLYSPTLTSMHDYWKNDSFDCIDPSWQSHVSVF